MKSIAIATPHYHPETGAAARRLTALAEHLASHGWRVRVVTLLPNHPQNRVYDGFDRRSGEMTVEHDVEVVRLRPWLVPKDNLAMRLAAETAFSVNAVSKLARSGADVILTSSPYMGLGPAGRVAAWLRGVPFVWDVRDLTWLYPRAAGKRTFGLDRGIGRAMKHLAAHCDGLVTASEGFMTYFERRPNVTMVMPNGVTERQIRAYDAPSPRSQPPRAVFAGLFGYNQDLETLLGAAKHLPEVRFILAGDGPRTSMIKAFVAEHELHNVELAGYLDQAGLERLYRSATVLVSVIKDEPIHRWIQPAKLWEYLATGTPVVHAGRGEIADLLTKNRAIRCVVPGNPAALADAIRDLIDDPGAGSELGARGRRFVKTHRRRSTLLTELQALLNRAMEEESRLTPR